MDESVVISYPDNVNKDSFHSGTWKYVRIKNEHLQRMTGFIRSEEKEIKKMAIVKVIEVLAESDVSWEDAAQNALEEASQTVENIKSIYIKDMQAVVENNRIVTYRVNAKISFQVKEQ
jgi:hypothetical protein